MVISVNFFNLPDSANVKCLEIIAGIPTLIASKTFKGNPSTRLVKNKNASAHERTSTNSFPF